MKSYAVPWNGELVLACRKCQKKLKGDAELGDLSKLKKAVKRHNKAHPESALALLNVPCMDLCPKNGVTVCVAAERPPRLRILRSADLRSLDLRSLDLRSMDLPSASLRSADLRSMDLPSAAMRSVDQLIGLPGSQIGPA